MPSENELQPALIEEQLARIISSSGFKNSGILTDFLSFVVSNTINSNEQKLKEYVIAINVLKRKSDFNPQYDAIVRIHAKRLRDALENYYRQTGKNDPIRISMPKGRYIPLFELNNHKQNTNLQKTKRNKIETHLKPLIAVLPFVQHISNQKSDLIGSILCEDLSAELTHFQEFSVISNRSTRVTLEKINGQEDLARHLELDYIITGSCTEINNTYKITVELIYVEDLEQIWAETFFVKDFETDQSESYNLLIRKVIVSIGGYFGLIYRDILSRQAECNYPENSYLFAVYWYHYYYFNFSTETFEKALKAIGTAYKNNPNNAFLSALLGEIFLNIHVSNTHPEINFFDKGFNAAQNAIKLDPLCHLAYVVMGWAFILQHNLRELNKTVEKIVGLNPNNLRSIGTVGFGYICIGEYDKGFKMQSESMKIDPFYPWFYGLGFSLYYLATNQLDEALNWAKKINRPDFIWDPLLRSSILGLLGDNLNAEKAVAELLVVTPDIKFKAKIIAGIMLADEKLVRQIIEGLKLAGIQVED